MKTYDLTLPFSKDTLVFPGTPEMSYEHTHTIEEVHYNLGLISVNTHAGTHTDAPLHFIDKGKDLAQVDFNKYVGMAVVIDCTYREAKEAVTVADVAKYEDKITEHKRVIIRTGWSKYYNEDKFFTDYPYVSLELAKWLADRDVVMVGVEPPTLNGAEYIEVHQVLLGNGIAVVEGLCNLDQLERDEVFFVGAPLPLKDGDGFPIRAIAIEF